MRIPTSWLAEFCPVRLSPEDLGDLLTARGLKLERLLRPWEVLGGIRVARVLAVEDHPKADRLCVATVDDGASERQVVVGVRNMAPGDLVPYAAPGATLPGFEGKLERRELRGVTSDGMLCSPKELAISGDHSGILVLPAEAEPGEDLKSWLGLDDAVLDIEVVPNRPDLLSVYGVAREAAAATGEDLVPLDTSAAEGERTASDAATVEVHDRDRCPEYLARIVTGVRIGPSPLRAQIRLSAAGMRPLSNVVDATNYAMLELGQPMHPFDLRLLAGPGIVVRRAAEGEALTTLDEVERILTAEDLVIADGERAVAIAGVMGGGATEVGEETSDVLLESAHFQPLGVLRTARRLGLRTEASVRFERGADPEAVGPAAARASSLIAEWAGGTVLRGTIDVGGSPPRRTVAVRPDRAEALLGREVTSAAAREALGHLRLPATEEKKELIVEIPGYRVDLELEVDLIEEIGRMLGYETLPSTLPGNRQSGGLDRSQRLVRSIEDVLAGAGVTEIRSVSFAAAEDLAGVSQGGTVEISNPISEEDAHLRNTLLPGLLRAARHNVAQRRTSVRLFEIGRVFVPTEGVPREPAHVAALVTGPRAEGWPDRGGDHDFLDAKGLVEHLLATLGIENWKLDASLGLPWHPGRSVEVTVAGEPAGRLGELHPSVAEAFDLPGRVAAFELDVDVVVSAAADEVAYRDVSRFPPVHRDLAFLVDRDVSAGSVRAALVETAGDLLDRVLLFDVFEGDPLPEGKRSLAFSLDFRAQDRTLTDAEVEDRVRAIAERLHDEVGAELRTA
ncbi:MAG: phenylalanine--tRNA ligase subunit beta [Actinomycetota bacterium]|nr:phenylalanine--tRNA ligase subunit beta [Actinomycetota bacterium]